MNKLCFTVDYNGITKVLNTPCCISKAFNPKNSNGTLPPQMVQFRAIWDTGATNSVITRRVVDVLGLNPSGIVNASTAGGEYQVRTYAANIFLPNNVIIPMVRVSEGILKDIEVLIGMDIISLGDFSITHNGSKTKFSFQLPPTHCIDFVQESNDEK